jgi:hypothetical protein
MSDDEKREAIRDAIAYRSGPDPCNSHYMGQMAKANLTGLLGGRRGWDNPLDLLAGADTAALDAGLAYCQHYLPPGHAALSKVPA